MNSSLLLYKKSKNNKNNKRAKKKKRLIISYLQPHGSHTQRQRQQYHSPIHPLTHHRLNSFPPSPPPNPDRRRTTPTNPHPRSGSCDRIHRKTKPLSSFSKILGDSMDWPNCWKEREEGRLGGGGGLWSRRPAGAAVVLCFFFFGGG